MAKKLTMHRHYYLDPLEQLLYDWFTEKPIALRQNSGCGFGQSRCSSQRAKVRISFLRGVFVAGTPLIDLILDEQTTPPFGDKGNGSPEQNSQQAARDAREFPELSSRRVRRRPRCVQIRHIANNSRLVNPTFTKTIWATYCTEHDASLLFF